MLRRSFKCAAPSWAGGPLTCPSSKAEPLSPAGLSGSIGSLSVLSPTTGTVNGRQLSPVGPRQQLSVQKNKYQRGRQWSRQMCLSRSSRIRASNLVGQAQVRGSGVGSSGMAVFVHPPPLGRASPGRSWKPTGWVTEFSSSGGVRSRVLSIGRRTGSAEAACRYFCLVAEFLKILFWFFISCWRYVVTVLAGGSLCARIRAGKRGKWSDRPRVWRSVSLVLAGWGRERNVGLPGVCLRLRSCWKGEVLW